MKIFKKNFNPTFSVSPLLDNKIIYRKNKILKFTRKILNHYVVNGNLYFIKVEDLKKNKNFFSKKFNISITNSKKLSLDIDTIYDLENAKSMIK
jgi:CMP-N-acetylneuraminic acid synthetase